MLKAFLLLFCAPIVAVQVVKLAGYSTLSACQAGAINGRIYALQDTATDNEKCNELVTLTGSTIMSAEVKERFSSRADVSLVRCVGVDDCSASCVLENIECGMDCQLIGSTYVELECSSSTLTSFVVLAMSLALGLVFFFI